MRIVGYDDADHDEVLAMNLQAFGWPITESTAKKYLRFDERWMDILGLYAVERGRTLGQVLPLKIRTKTAEGEETVGGIAGVTVVPDRARQGIALSLMRAAHDLFRDNDIRISFLLTMESLVAHSLYRKLGYFDAISFGAAQKLVKVGVKPKNVELNAYRKKDWRKTDLIYSRSTRGFLGFSIRQRAFLNMKIDTTPLTKKGIKIVEGESAEGYVVLSPSEEYIIVREIVCPNDISFNKIMAAVEAEVPRKYVLTYFLTPRTNVRRFGKRGYKVERSTWGRIMVAPLNRGLSNMKVRELYDFGGAFCIMALDTF